MTGSEAPEVAAIWAQAHGGVIGRGGTMPWHVPEDMAFFVEQTMGHPVIMGRRTWESIPSAYRPFAGRTNIVITRQAGFLAEGALVCPDLESALRAAAQSPGGDLVWLAGGGQVYAEGLRSGVVDRAVITRLDLEIDGDTHAPALDPSWATAWSSPEQGPGETAWHTSRTGVRYRFEERRRPA